MSENTNTYISFADALVRDDAIILATGVKSQLAAMAVKEFSIDFPRTRIMQVTGLGTNTYALPTDFYPEVSEVEEIEYPIGSVPRDLVYEENWDVIQTADETWKLILTEEPGNLEQFRVSYTTLHTVNDSSSTIPDALTPQFVHLLCKYICEALATYYAQTKEPTLSIDSVNYRRKSDEYRSLAKAFFESYKGNIDKAAGLVKSCRPKLVTGRDTFFDRK